MCAHDIELLCKHHQAIGVWVLRLALTPLMIIRDVSAGIVSRLGLLVGSMAFVCIGICSWWYWVRLSFTPLSGGCLTRSFFLLVWLCFLFCLTVPVCLHHLPHSMGVWNILNLTSSLFTPIS